MIRWSNYSQPCQHLRITWGTFERHQCLSLTPDPSDQKLLNQAQTRVSFKTFLYDLHVQPRYSTTVEVLKRIVLMLMSYILHSGYVLRFKELQETMQIIVSTHLYHTFISQQFPGPSSSPFSADLFYLTVYSFHG